MSETIQSGRLSSLVEEALRRLEAYSNGAGFDSNALFDILSAHIQSGRRDMFSLVRAGRRAMDGH